MNYQPLSPDFLDRLKKQYNVKIAELKDRTWNQSYELCSNSLINNGFKRTLIENCIDILKKSKDSNTIKFCQGKSIIRAELWSKNNFTNLYILFVPQDLLKIAMYYSQGETIDEFSNCTIYVNDAYVSDKTKTYFDKLQLDAIKLVSSGQSPDGVFSEIAKLSLHATISIDGVGVFDLTGESLFSAIIENFFPKEKS
ncbi:MAG: hypothetical protein JW923_11145 [Spirochaetales bacterium]|nr:hypothetical protein [Spirochaetales bacterium]